MQDAFALFRPHQQLKGTFNNGALGFESGQLLRFARELVVNLNVRPAHASYRTPMIHVYVYTFPARVARTAASENPSPRPLGGEGGSARRFHQPRRDG